jgi:hypothetical protein
MAKQRDGWLSWYRTCLSRQALWVRVQNLSKIINHLARQQIFFWKILVPLKVLKRENCYLAFFTLSNPIFVGDSETNPKNRLYLLILRLIFDILVFKRMLSLHKQIFEPTPRLLINLCAGLACA